MNEYINYFLNYLQTKKDTAKSVSNLGKASHNKLEKLWQKPSYKLILLKRCI